MNKSALLFLWMSILVPQSIAERFIVPIYYEFSAAAGYDSNLFNFSGSEMDAFSAISPELQDIAHFDSGSFKPVMKITYIPQILTGIETRFYGTFSQTFFPQASQKNYHSILTKIDFHFGSFHSLKTGYSFIPEYFLRRYSDIDLFNSPLEDCTFSKSTKFLAYTFPIVSSNWVKLQADQTYYFFNSNFTEFDTQMDQLKLQGSFNLNSYLKGNILIGFARGKNISFDAGLVSTHFDRSYEMVTGRAGLKTVALLNGELEFLRVQAEIQNRQYLSESAYDPLHNGRQHIDIKLKFTVRKKLKPKVFIESYLNVRKRNTSSGYDFVENLKSFQKFEVGLRFILQGYLDIYY